MNRRAGLVLLLSLLLGACGYFNSLYNAQRRFREGERADGRGATAEAARSYQAAVAGAATSYRKHPDSRWSDDALLLIGRARFAMGEHAAARAALGRALEQSRDEELRAAAAIYLGAALVRLAHPDSALAPLVQGLGASDEDSELHALGRLWQGRARLALGDSAGWQDLEFVAAHDGPLSLDGQLELATLALIAADSARGLHALAALFEGRRAEAKQDTAFRLVERARAAWGPAAVVAVLPADAGERWQAEGRTRVRFQRAALLAATGDTAAAVAAAISAAGQSSGPRSGEAREAAAHWLLARADGIEDLPQVRAVLLPAVTHSQALLQVRRVRTLDVLLERARTGQAAALFAAAEYARDTLASPRLARQLFLAYADVAPTAVWAPKALLAALALSDGEERAALEGRILQQPDNPYVAAVQGRPDAQAFQDAEERLGRAVSAVRADAAVAAQTGDLRVGRAVAVLDSLREMARSDSVRVRCGSLLDSLSLTGIRGDSVRAACLRSDSASVGRFVTIDTLQLRDSAASRGARPRAGGDTLGSR